MLDSAWRRAVKALRPDHCGEAGYWVVSARIGAVCRRCSPMVNGQAAPVFSDRQAFLVAGYFLSA